MPFLAFYKLLKTNVLENMFLFFTFIIDCLYKLSFLVKKLCLPLYRKGKKIKQQQTTKIYT